MAGHRPPGRLARRSGRAARRALADLAAPGGVLRPARTASVRAGRLMPGPELDRRKPTWSPCHRRPLAPTARRYGVLSATGGGELAAVIRSSAARQSSGV